jgi:hypothetical protein
MTKIKRFYVVHELNENFGKYGVRYYCKKGTFFPAKEGVHKRNTFFVLYMRHYIPEKRALFSLLKKVGGAGDICPHCPSWFRDPWFMTCILY